MRYGAIASTIAWATASSPAARIASVAPPGESSRRTSVGSGESQYYVEPKRLARLGYLEARREPGRTRERTVYTLTAEGRRALREYARTPVRFQPVKSDLLLRLLIADLVGEAPTRESVATLREDVAELLARLDENEADAAKLPHRQKYLVMVNGFLRRLLELHLEWVDEIERELAPGKAPVDSGSRS